MKEKLKTITQLNWVKTLYINFKMLPFADAIKLPIFVYGRCRLNIKGGRIIFNIPIKRGVLKIGYQYETFSFREPIELKIHGILTIQGNVWIGTAVHLLVESTGHLTMGQTTRLGSCASLYCNKEVTIAENTGIASFVEITDSNYHYMKNTIDQSISPFVKPVFIGSKNYICSRVAILPGTMTPNNITIAYGTVCNKDYRDIIPENSVIAGIPAKLVKENIVRIFDFEKEAEISRYFKETGKDVYYDTDES